MGIRILLGVAIVATAAGSQGNAERPRWADSEVFVVNKEPAHAFSLVFPDEDSARPEPRWANPFAASSRYRMLNGKWKFQWSENPASAPADFYRRAFRGSNNWKEQRVVLDPPIQARYIKIGLVNNGPEFFHLQGVKVFKADDARLETHKEISK